MAGRSLDDYGAPLFLAWQLTNGCEAKCLACCEESGRKWPDELTRDESLDLARQVVALGIPYAAFGGGEPLVIPHCWDIFDVLAEGGVSIKLETNGLHIDEVAAVRLHELGLDCVQISIDGATAAMHERARPGSSFDAALAAIDRLAACGTKPQLVFVPTRLNIGDMIATYDLAARHGCGAFVTGPLMRLGRAAVAYDDLSVDDATWASAVDALREHAAQSDDDMMLSIYPWDIVTELETRLDSPQAMLLVVPNGKVKLLNALPFAAADIRKASLAQSWEAYRAAWRTPVVANFIGRCRGEPALLRHANETWEVWTER